MKHLWSLFSFFVLVILVFLTPQSSAQMQIAVRLDSSCFNSVVLYAVRGYDQIPVDSIHIEKKLQFTFNINERIPVGVYKIVFDDRRAMDVILENKSFSLKTNCNDFINGSIFENSESNTLLYNFRKYKDKKARDIYQEKLQKKFLSYTSDSNKKVMSDSIDKRIEEHTDSIYKYGEDMVNMNRNSFASSVIQAMMVPKLSVFKKSGKLNKEFSNEKDFLATHFFDNIDFSDTNLIHSEVFYLAAKTYIERISGRSNEELMNTARMILKKSEINKKMYLHVLDILMALFEYGEQDEIYVYLVENFYNYEFCETASEKNDILQRIEAIKNMKKGKKIPNFEAPDINGKPVNLYSTKAKHSLIIFWSVYCEHCEEIIPALVEHYKHYKPLGFEVISFSIDSTKSDWVTASEELKIPWINLNDLKGGKGDIPKMFNVWHTPTMYFIDKNFSIVAIPKSAEELEYWLNTLFR